MMIRSSRGAIALVAIGAAVATVVLGAVTLADMGNAGGGDMMVSPNPGSTILLLLGALLLIEFELAHLSRRRPARRRATGPAPA
jgi:hypothetical protein